MSLQIVAPHGECVVFDKAPVYSRLRYGNRRVKTAALCICRIVGESIKLHVISSHNTRSYGYVGIPLESIPDLIRLLQKQI